MKNPGPILIAVLVIVLIAAASFLFYRNQQSAGINSPQQSEKLDSATNASFPETVTQEYLESSISGTPVPSKAPFTSYIYPNSEVVNQTQTHLELSSSDEPDAVTDWYKNMIGELNFNAKSFAQTSSDGVVFNKLSAAKPAEKLEINIKKDQTASIVVITVDRF